MTPRTQTDDKGNLWTLDGDRWLAAPDLVVTTSGKGKAREFSPGRDPGRKYDVMSAACEAEVRIAAAQRERVLADLDLARAIKAREREAAAESTRAAERKAGAERRTALRWAAGLTAGWLVAVLACAGVWGMA